MSNNNSDNSNNPESASKKEAVGTDITKQLSNNISLPDRRQIETFVHENVQSTVKAINTGLATIEERITQQVRSLPNFQGPISTVSQQGFEVIAQVTNFYRTQRYEYGPHIILGTTVTTGLYTSILRRQSRIPAFATALTAGALTYGIIYNNPFINDDEEEKK